MDERIWCDLAFKIARHIVSPESHAAPTPFDGKDRLSLKEPGSSQLAAVGPKPVLKCKGNFHALAKVFDTPETETTLSAFPEDGLF